MHGIIIEKPNDGKIIIQRFFCAKICKYWCVGIRPTPVLRVDQISLLKSGVAIRPVVEVIKWLGVIK
jgi:hypothetical protein